VDSGQGPASDDFERLDRVLRQLSQVLDAPGEGDASPETSWRKLDIMYASMGPDALGVLLRRQGMDRASIGEAIEVLESRHRLMR
jgi:hypothetical protein